MIWITNAEEYWRHEKLIDHFFQLYEDPANFPDPDERENPVYIRERIETGSALPHTHLLVVENQGGDGVSAGAIVEFYPESQCALLTYLFVDPNTRGQGLAKKIIQGEDGLQKGIQLFSQLYGKSTLAVLFESNNPNKTKPGEDSMDPQTRLAVFKKSGAKILDIPYVQPSLDETKAPVDNLYLLTFPQLCGLVDRIDKSLVLGFYREFCRSLDASPAFEARELANLGHYLHNDNYIRLLDI